MNPWSITTILATAVAWIIAAFVLRNAHGRIARRLGILLIVEGGAVITTELGLMLLAGSAEAARTISLVHAAFDLTLLVLYLPFLATALNAPALRVFQRPLVEKSLFAIGVVGLIAIAAAPGAFIGEGQAVPAPLRWTVAWGGMMEHHRALAHRDVHGCNHRGDTGVAPG